MPSIKPFGLALLVLGLSACASLGQSGNRDNEVKVAAQKLIGQPAGKAFELFGKPDQGLGPSSYGSGGFYAWNRVRTHMGPDKVFIQTGTEYVGQRETWVGVGGQGVAGMAPVSSEAVYRKAGYYENETILDYFCSITLYTDSRDIITNASVIDCRDSRCRGRRAPAFLLDDAPRRGSPADHGVTLSFFISLNPYFHTSYFVWK